MMALVYWANLIRCNMPEALIKKKKSLSDFLPWITFATKSKMHTALMWANYWIWISTYCTMVHFWWHKSVTFYPRQLLMVTHSKLQLEGFGMSWLLQHVWSMDRSLVNHIVHSTLFLFGRKSVKPVYLTEICIFNENYILFNFFIPPCSVTSQQNLKRVLLKPSTLSDKKKKKNVSFYKMECPKWKSWGIIPEKKCCFLKPKNIAHLVKFRLGYKTNILK